MVNLVPATFLKDFRLFTKNQKIWLCGRGDLTSLFFSKVVKYYKSGETYLLTLKIRRVYESTVRPAKIMP